MRERYLKVLTRKLDEYLPTDIASQMLEDDLGGKPPVFFECVCVCVCVGWGIKILCENNGTWFESLPISELLLAEEHLNFCI
jgi:hypothetical protein